jgi:glycyl-tRNA synthetase
LDLVLLVQVLTQELGGLVAGLSFKKSMRWNSSAAFSRPVRWLLGLHGQSALPFAFAGLQAGPSSQGLRSDGQIQVSSSDDYMYATPLRFAVGKPLVR